MFKPFVPWAGHPPAAHRLVLFNQHSQASTNHRVIVDDHDADRLGDILAGYLSLHHSGITTATTVKSASTDTWVSPPSSPALSTIERGEKRVVSRRIPSLSSGRRFFICNRNLPPSHRISPRASLQRACRLTLLTPSATI